VGPDSAGQLQAVVFEVHAEVPDKFLRYRLLSGSVQDLNDSDHRFLQEIFSVRGHVSAVRPGNLPDLFPVGENPLSRCFPDLIRSVCLVVDLWWIYSHWFLLLSSFD
jgi:hypothetical protein